MLIECRECKKPVSVRAETCLNCGAPVEDPIEVNARKMQYVSAAKHAAIFPLLYVAITLGLQFWYDNRTERYIERQVAELVQLYPEAEERMNSPEFQDYVNNVPRRPNLLVSLYFPIPNAATKEFRDLAPPVWSVALQGLWLWLLFFLAFMRTSWGGFSISSFLPSLITYVLSGNPFIAVIGLVIGIFVSAIVFASDQIFPPSDK